MVCSSIIFLINKPLQGFMAQFSTLFLQVNVAAPYFGLMGMKIFSSELGLCVLVMPPVPSGTYSFFFR